MWSLDSRSVTWELVRNANSDLVSQKVWGWGPAICVLTRAPEDAQALSRARPVGLREATCCCRSHTIGSPSLATHWHHWGRFRNWVTVPTILIALVRDVGWVLAFAQRSPSCSNVQKNLRTTALSLWLPEISFSLCNVKTLQCKHFLRPQAPIIKCHCNKKRVDVSMYKRYLADMFIFHNIPLHYNLSMENKYLPPSHWENQR